MLFLCRILLVEVLLSVPTSKPIHYPGACCVFSRGRFDYISEVFGVTTTGKVLLSSSSLPLSVDVLLMFI